MPFEAWIARNESWISTATGYLKLGRLCHYFPRVSMIKSQTLYSTTKNILNQFIPRLFSLGFLFLFRLFLCVVSIGLPTSVWLSFQSLDDEASTGAAFTI